MYHKRDAENYKRIACVSGSLPGNIKEKIAGNLADRNRFLWEIPYITSTRRRFC